MTFRTASAAWCLALASLLASPAARTWAQEPTEVPNVLIQVPREYRQHADQLQEALSSSAQLADAAAHLDELFTIVARGDAFLVREGETLAGGVKRELWRTTVTLPQPVLDAYEELKGPAATAELRAALGKRDFQAIEAVADRWFATRAGGQARLVLARIYLDRGLPHEALHCLEPLPDQSALAEPLQPELNLLRAVACILTGHTEAAQEIFRRLAKRYRTEQYRIGDRDIPLNDADTAVAELKQALGDPAQVTRGRVDGWLLHRADHHRSVTGNAPIPTHYRWVQPHSAAADHAIISELQDQFLSSDVPAVTSLSPIAAGDQVIYRTSHDLQAVDLLSGRLIWRYPPTRPARETDEPETEDQDTAQRITIRERVWNDAAHGQLSSDAACVFLLEQLELPTLPPSPLQPLGFGVPGTEQPSPANRLVALDLSRNGAFRWMLEQVHAADKEDSEPTFFLGVPTPAADALFAITESDNQLALMKIDTQTGRQHWLLTLVEASMGRDNLEGGVSPSYHEGVLICPTNLGAVVAVDVSTRRFLWGFRYAWSGRPTTTRLIRRSPQVGQGWQDNVAIIAGNRVLVAPAGADLYCLDFQTGRLLWQRRRSDLLFVAAANEDTVLLVGKHRFTALRMADGTPAWPDAPFVAIPAGGMPSGRGYLSGQSYWLPTTDPELLEIDMHTGTTVRHRPTNQALGNLICSRGCVVSQSSLTIACLDTAADDVAPSELRNPAVLPLPQCSQEGTGQLLKWLSHPDFAWREAASLELSRRAGDALPNLAGIVHSGDPESALRAAHILIQLLDSSDPDVVFQVRQILSRASSNSVERSFATRLLAQEALRREPLARYQLRQLGATLDESGKKVVLGPRWTGGNDGLRHLQWLTQLETLELRHGDITDEGLRQLQGLEHIQSLNLHRTQVTSDGIACLVTLRGLRMLYLQNTQVDDRVLPYLKKLPNLRALNLLDTKLTSEAVEQLRQELPDTRVVF